MNPVIPHGYNELCRSFENNKEARIRTWSLIVRREKEYILNELRERIAQAVQVAPPSELDSSIGIIQKDFACRFEIQLRGVERVENGLTIAGHYREDNGLKVKDPAEKKELIEKVYPQRLSRQIRVIRREIKESTPQDIIKQCQETRKRLQQEIQFFRSQIDELKVQKSELKKERDKFSDSHQVFDACWMGNLAIVKQELEKFRVPLVWGENKRLEFIKNAVEGGEGDYADLTLLSIAAFEGHLDILLYLLKQGAPLDLQDKRHHTPLHWAAKRGRIAVAGELFSRAQNDAARTALVRAEAKPTGNGPDYCYLRTPLHYAAHNGHSEMMRLLLQRGAEVNAQQNENDRKATPLLDAVQRYHTTCVQVLCERPDLEVNTPCLRGSTPITPLQLAVENESPEIVEMIISHRSWKCPSSEEDPNHPKQLMKIAKGPEKGIINEILAQRLSKIPQPA